MTRYALLFVTVALAACSDDIVAPRPPIHDIHFSASAITGPYSFAQLGNLGGGLSIANDLNDRDEIVGYSSTSESPGHAFLWAPSSPGATTGAMTDLNPSSGKNTFAYGINGTQPAYIVGREDAPGAEFAVYWQPNLDGSGYTMHELPDLVAPSGGRSGQANAINDHGLIVGQDGDLEQISVATIWDVNSTTPTELIPGSQYQSAALALNNNGQVVGWFRDVTSDYQAFVWQNGSYAQLPDLPAGDPASGQGPSAMARGINDAGQIAGWSTDADHHYHAVVWEASISGYTVTDLGTQFTDPATEGPFDINRNGVVAGNIANTLTIWQNTGSGWTATSLPAAGGDVGVGMVGGINSLAHIVGTSSNNEASSAFLATPPQQNQAPVANAGGPYSAIAGEAVTLDGSGSSDPDGDTLTYDWEFGDHSTGTGATPSHVYAAPGSYSVVLTVSDGQASSTAQATVTVAARPPFLIPCGSTITGIAYDGTNYYIGDGHNGLNHCIGRYSASGALLETKVFAIDIRGLHYVPATGKLVARTWGGPLFEVDYAAGTQQVLTNYNPTASRPGDEQSQPAADPDGTSYWILNSGHAERHQLTDNALLTAFGVVTTASNQTIAVTNLWVLVLNGAAVNVYSKSGLLLGSQPLPSAHGCDYYGFGASASGDRIMYDSNCSHALVVTVTGTFNQPPVAGIGGPYSGKEGSVVAFDGSGSTDPDGDPLSYAWDFGDGSRGTGLTTSHTYVQNGSYTVGLTVTDSHGATNSSSTTATITNVAPTVNAGTYADVVSGQKLSFSGRFSDPGLADSLWRYTLDWGDGTRKTGTTASQDSAITATHTYSATGTFTITLSVKDKEGETGVGTATIRVVANAAPVAVISGPTSGDEGAALAFDATRSSDPNGDKLTYQWDWGDGSLATNGSTPNHKYADNGSFVVTLLASDGKLTGVAKSTVTINNVAPTATFGRPASIPEGGGFALSLTKPKDPSTKDVAVGFGYAFDCGNGYGAFSPADSVACPVQPDEATLTVRGKIQDKDGGTSEYTNTVTVKNVAPQVTLTAGGPTTFPVGSTFTVTGSFSDPGVKDSPWGYIITWGDGTTATTGFGTPGVNITASHKYTKKTGANGFNVKLSVTEKNGTGATGTSLPITVTVQ